MTINWLDRWRRLPRALQWLAIVFAVCFGLWSFEDLRGRIHLIQVERKWAARGLPLTWEGVLERSGGKPGGPTLVDALAEGKWDHERIGAIRTHLANYNSKLGPEQRRNGSSYGRQAPLVAHLPSPAPSDPVKALAAELAAFDDSLAVLKRALAAPDLQAFDCSQRPLLPSDSGDTHSALSVLRWRSLIAMERGELEAARSDLATMLEVLDASGRPCILTMNVIFRDLVGAAVTQAHWAALAARIWDAQGLEKLARQLAELDMEVPLTSTLLAEAIQLKELWIEHPREDFRRDNLVDAIGSSPTWSLDPADFPGQAARVREMAFGFLLPPGAFHDWNAVYLDRFATATFENRPLSAVKIGHATWWDEFFPVSEMWGASLSPIEEQNRAARQRWKLFRAAVELERDCLRNGDYPDVLPAAIPGDEFFHRKPLRYRRTEDGRFVLYSVGSNHIDDGGDPIKDIVWRYSPD